MTKEQKCWYCGHLISEIFSFTNKDVCQHEVSNGTVCGCEISVKNQNSSSLLDEITLYCDICYKPVCIIKESKPTSIHRVCCVTHE